MREERKDDAYSPELPSPGPAAYLWDYLWEAGPTVSGGMGAAPLTHAELNAWQDASGIYLNAWEASTLRRLSAAYLDQVQESRNPECPSPMAPPEMSTEDRKRVSDKVSGVFGALARKGKAR